MLPPIIYTGASAVGVWEMCGCRAVPVRGDGGGRRRLGMGKVRGGEVGEGSVPREGQLLDPRRCCHHWFVGIEILRLSVPVCVRRVKIGNVQCGFCFVDSVCLND